MYSSIHLFPKDVGQVRGVKRSQQLVCLFPPMPAVSRQRINKTSPSCRFSIRYHQTGGRPRSAHVKRPGQHYFALFTHLAQHSYLIFFECCVSQSSRRASARADEFPNKIFINNSWPGQQSQQHKSYSSISSSLSSKLISPTKDTLN